MYDTLCARGGLGMRNCVYERILENPFSLYTFPAV